MPAENGKVSRESTEYAEILAEVLVETVQKSAGKAMCGEHDEITPSLMECLQYVYLHGASPVSQIAHGLEISLPAASQLVDRLVRKDLATRRENEPDRRLTRVEITAAGQDLVRQMRRRKSEWFESILSGMPEDQRRAFRDGVEGFLSVALAEAGGADGACERCGVEHMSFCVVNRVKSAAHSLERPQEESIL